MSSIPKGIAQAKTFATAYTVLTIELVFIAFLIGSFANSWWWSLSVPIAIVVCGLYKWFRTSVILGLSLFWGALFFKISLEAGGGLPWAIPVSALVAFFAAGINMAGMTGFMNSVPDFTNQ